MRLSSIALAAVLSTALAFGAKANDCDQLVIDYTKIANRKIDVAKVESAARSLASEGAIVRVRVYDTLRGSPTIDALAEKVERECKWRIDGRLQTNMIFVPFAVEKGDIAVRTGSAINARISETAATRAIMTHVAPRWQSYKKDPGALTAGLVSLLGSFRVVLAQPVTLPQVGQSAPRASSQPVVIRQSNDGSWVWKTFLVIGGIAVFGFGALVFVRSRQDSSDASAARAEASRVRSGCIDRLIKLTDEQEIVVRKARADDVKRNLTKSEMHDIDGKLAESERLGKQGIAAFSRFDSFDKDDPNRTGLSIAAYSSNQVRYEEIIVEYVEPAEALIADLEKKLEAAEKEADAA
jgi:hypothetical protein